MSMVPTTTKVLLPKHLLNLQITHHEFRTEVIKYLERYPNYQLDRVEGEFAICLRMDIQTMKGRKKRG